MVPHKKRHTKNIIHHIRHQRSTINGNYSPRIKLKAIASLEKNYISPFTPDADIETTVLSELPYPDLEEVEKKIRAHFDRIGLTDDKHPQIIKTLKYFFDRYLSDFKTPNVTTLQFDKTNNEHYLLPEGISPKQLKSYFLIHH